MDTGATGGLKEKNLHYRVDCSVGCSQTREPRMFQFEENNVNNQFCDF